MFHQVFPRFLNVSNALCLCANAIANETSPEFSKKKSTVNEARAATNIHGSALSVGFGPAKLKRTDDASQAERGGAARLKGVRVQSMRRRSTQSFPDRTKAS